MSFTQILPSDFSQLLPEDFPKVVYKYRDWSNDFHKKTLINGELFLSSPANFNDPIDCKIPIAYYKLTDDPTMALRYFEEFVERQHSEMSQKQKQLRVEELIKEGRIYDPNWNTWQEQQQFDAISKTYGILSFSQHKAKMLLWSHYASSHTGYCIGFKTDQLFFNERRFGSGGKIIYEKEMPIILPIDDLREQIIKQLFVKSDVWEYEDEYRVTKIHAANQIVEFTQKEVAEIIIGASMNESDVKSITNICKCNFPTIPIYRCKIIPRTFKLGFEKIN